MKVIRDEETCGIAMIPLFVDWNIRRCNVKGCTQKPTTIVTELGESIPIVGLCEEHYQQGDVPGGATFTFYLG